MYKEPDGTLGDGAELVLLKLEYLRTRTDRSLFALLDALQGSVVLVPCTASAASENDKRPSGGSVRDGSETRLRPEFVTAPNGKRWFPIFSQRNQIPDSANGRYSFIKMYVSQCVELARSAKNLEGLVLDAFTKPVLLPFRVLDAASKLSASPD